METNKERQAGQHKYLGSILSAGRLFIMLLWTIWNYKKDTSSQWVHLHSKNNHAVHAHLVVVSSLLDELVDYFLCLLVTFLLQVSDECVQMAWTVICLYNRLMSLNNPSYTCKHATACLKATPKDRVHRQSIRVFFLPSRSSVRVSANTSCALFSLTSPPVAKNRFSSALEASCVKQTLWLVLGV